MKYFIGSKIGRVFALRLDQGEYLLESICELVERERVKDAVVVSAIGTVDTCTLHMVTYTGYPSMNHYERISNRAMELSVVEGMIVDGKPHLHALVADKHSVYTGHLENGTRVMYLAELTIIEVLGWNLCRTKNEHNITVIDEKGE